MAAITGECWIGINHLNLKYQEGLHQADLIHRDEAERSLALKALALRDANAVLEDLAFEKGLEVSCSAFGVESLKTELSHANELSHQQELGLQNMRSEIHSLKIEIENLNKSGQISKNAREENAALSQELNRLRTELEHLKSQLTSHQVVVASNGDLRRQINTLEVELDNEKRAKLRAQQADNSGTVSDLRSKLQQSEANLKVEVKERETLRRELASAQSLQEKQKDRMDSIKSKLKETEEALKGTQEDLRDTKRELAGSRKHIAAADAATVAAPEPQKRVPGAKRARVVIEPPQPVIETSMDEEDIQSPRKEDLSEARQPRRGTGRHALLGEKSTFSITPFLNKSHDITDYPELDSDKSALEAELKSSPEQPQKGKAQSSRATSPVKAKRSTTNHRQKIRSRAKQTVDDEFKLSKPIIGEVGAISTAGPKKRGVLGSIAGVLPPGLVDGDSDSDSGGTGQRQNLVRETSTVERDECSKTQGADAEGRTKRRKLLGGKGATMFDEEEIDAAENPGNPFKLAPGKRARAQLGGVTNAFAGSGKTFSPLKRQRRGVNASFLG